MSRETMLNNTTELEEILAMAQGLPDAGSTGGLNPDLNLLVLGDSLFGGPIGKEFINSLGCKIENRAKSGATLAAISENASIRDGAIVYNRILQQMADFVAEVNAEKNTGIKEGEGELPFHEPDIILLDGGGNDYTNGAVMGSLYSEPTPYRMSGSNNVKTVLGALEDLLYNLNRYYPKAQKFFLSMHRVNQCDQWTLMEGTYKYWPNTRCCIRVPYGSNNWEILYRKWSDTSRTPYRPVMSIEELEAETTLYVTKYTAVDSDGDGKYENITKGAVEFSKTSIYSNGNVDMSKISGYYTYDELRENINKGCQMYGVKVIDMYNESCLSAVPLIKAAVESKPVTSDSTTVNYWHVNGIQTKVRSDVILTAKPEVYIADVELFDWEGIHPTLLGYQVGYEPYVRQALSLGTKKTDT